MFKFHSLRCLVFQHYLLKKLSFLHCIFLPPSHRLIDIVMWVYFWALHPVPLICVCDLCQYYGALTLVAWWYSLRASLVAQMVKNLPAVLAT